MTSKEFNKIEAMLEEIIYELKEIERAIKKQGR